MNLIVNIKRTRYRCFRVRMFKRPLALALVLFLFLTSQPLAPADANHNEQTFIRLNQIGYRPSDAKIAVVLSRAPPKRIRTASARRSSGVQIIWSWRLRRNVCSTNE
jgi:hypothetical protein